MTSVAVPSPVALPLHHLDTQIYARMVDSGALENQRVELLDGLLIEMSPQSTQHAAIIHRLTGLFAGRGQTPRVQLPLEVSGDSVPEPDIALVAQPPDPQRHPSTALLVVEVAVSSHDIDRVVKARLYAGANVLAYWIVDVPGLAVEVRRDPGPVGYRSTDFFRPGDVIPSPAGPVDVGSLLAGLHAAKALLGPPPRP